MGYLSFFGVLTPKSTITINKETMKKLLIIFVFGAFAACGGNAGSEATTDSSSVATDTTTMNSGSTSSDTGATSSSH